MCCRCSTCCERRASSSASSRTAAATSTRSSRTTALDGRRRHRLGGARPDETAPDDLPGDAARSSSVEPARRAMVGDSPEDDVEGALAAGSARVPARPRRTAIRSGGAPARPVRAARGARPACSDQVRSRCARVGHLVDRRRRAAAGEVFTPGLFVLGPVALAAVAAAIASLRRGRHARAADRLHRRFDRVARRCSGRSRAAHLRMPAAIRTGTAALSARRRSCSSGSTPTAAGSRSAARTGRRGRTRRAGDRARRDVEVVKIEGATALVYE